MIDAWEFDRAERYEHAGTPSLALPDYEAAVCWYRGPYMPQAGDWADAERARLAVRFVRAAVRAGELLVAAGRADEARRYGERALAVEEWSERAYRLVAAADLATGDRAAALRTLARCARMLADLGVEPEESTVAVARRAGLDRWDRTPSVRARRTI